MEKIIAYTDGASRGNPGPSAAAVYITTSAGKMVGEAKEALGNATPTFAEYYGVMLALQTLKQIYGEKSTQMQFEVRLDSELVQKQLSNEQQIKEPGLVPMFIEIHNMRVESFPHINFVLVPTENVNEADRQVREVLDGK